MKLQERRVATAVSKEGFGVNLQLPASKKGIRQIVIIRKKIMFEEKKKKPRLHPQSGKRLAVATWR